MLKVSAISFLKITFFSYILLLIACKSDLSKTDSKEVPETATETTVQDERPSFKMPSPDEHNGGLSLPGGFSALTVVDSVGPTRHIAVNANGDIYAKLRIATGRQGNVAIRDTNGDGKADIVKRWGDYPNDGSFATDMRINDGYLYFSSERVIYRQLLSPTQLIPPGKPEVIVRDPFPIRWHNAKTLAFDKKGYIYITFSAPTNACEDWSTAKSKEITAGVKGEDPCTQLNYLGAVWRYPKDKLDQELKDGEKYATGLRSIVGMTWNNEQDLLYAVNHGRDYLHEHAPQHFSKWENAILPSEEFMAIRKGDHFGWPYTYYDHIQKKRMLAPEYGGDGKITSNDYAMPVMGLPGHWAPNDLMFYTGDQFPDRYKNGAFVAFHGSTNTTPYPQVGYVVGFIPFKNGRPAGEMEIFADGFTGKEVLKTMQEATFRPMGLSQGPDGSLYISESRKGRIWRVMYQGDKTKFSEDNLAKMETLKKTKSYLRLPDEKRDIIK